MDNACLFVKVNASSLYTILRGNILTKSKKMLIRFISLNHTPVYQRAPQSGLGIHLF